MGLKAGKYSAESQRGIPGRLFAELQPYNQGEDRCEYAYLKMITKVVCSLHR